MIEISILLSLFTRSPFILSNYEKLKPTEESTLLNKIYELPTKLALKAQLLIKSQLIEKMKFGIF